MEQYLKIYNETNAKLKAFSMCGFLIGWDGQTEAPKGCFDKRAQRISVLSEMEYQLRTAPEYVQAIAKLFENRDSLDEVLRREITKQQEAIDNLKKIPIEDYVKYSELMGKSEAKYFEAKAKGDYKEFEPYLSQIIDYKRKFIKLLETKERKGYDVLLNDYEEGFTTKDCDKFFGALKTKLVPFVKKLARTPKKFNKNFLKKIYPADKQREFSHYIQQVMCFDLNHGVMKESEHPFTTGIDTKDVRVTIHYYEDNFLSAIFSAVHEMGHATYEQQVDEKLDDTLSGGGVSMGMHESQSRFYENIIGRSQAFCELIYPKLLQMYPKQLRKVTFEDFYKGVNLVEKSYIRTEADELTYPLHIMLRYDIERKIMSGKINVEQLPTEWNRLVKKYLGLTVHNDKEGILQDVHWAGGSFGYFPTYALGSAYAAQIYHKMKQEIDVDGIIASGSFADINAWLKEKIHRFGASKSPKDILLYATGEEFNPDYYIDYLIGKYSKIFGVEAD